MKGRKAGAMFAAATFVVLALQPHTPSWRFGQRCTTYTPVSHKVIMELNFQQEIEGMWFRGFFFSLQQEQYLWALVIDSLSLMAPQFLSAQITFQSVSHWPVSVQKTLSQRLHIQRWYSPPRSSWVVIRVHCHKFSVEDLRLYKATGPQELP